MRLIICGFSVSHERKVIKRHMNGSTLDMNREDDWVHFKFFNMRWRMEMAMAEAYEEIEKIINSALRTLMISHPT